MIKQKIQHYTIGWITILAFIIPLFSGPTADFETGKIIDRVACKDDEQQSYALYLPKDYTNKKRWPILFAFDPGARGTLPLNLFKTAAEKYGYIIACSNNVKNGPWKENFNAIKAVWKDTRQRLSINTMRIYATGFSGGSRAASTLPYVAGAPLSGIIACGAGLHGQMKAYQVKPAYYHAIIGLEDFNYKEFVALAPKLKQAGIEYTIDVIDGPHQWPPEDACTRAIEWMEVMGMKKGLREKDNPLIDSMYQQALKRAQNLEDQGHIYYAATFLRYASLLFKDLKDPVEISEKIDQLEQTKAYKKFVKEETKRNNKEVQLMNRFVGVFSAISRLDAKRITLNKAKNMLQVRNLVKLSESKKDIYDSAMAKRVLTELDIKGNREGRLSLEKGDHEKAIIFFTLALEANKQNPSTFLNLARVYSSINKKEKAIRNLKICVDLSIEMGYKDFSILLEDKYLDSIRSEKEFQDILKKVNQ